MDLIRFLSILMLSLLFIAHASAGGCTHVAHGTAPNMVPYLKDKRTEKIFGANVKKTTGYRTWTFVFKEESYAGWVNSVGTLWMKVDTPMQQTYYVYVETRGTSWIYSIDTGTSCESFNAVPNYSEVEAASIYRNPVHLGGS
jgi:hypothetical protein